MDVADPFQSLQRVARQGGVRNHRRLHNKRHKDQHLKVCRQSGSVVQDGGKTTVDAEWNRRSWKKMREGEEEIETRSVTEDIEDRKREIGGRGVLQILGSNISWPTRKRNTRRSGRN